MEPATRKRLGVVALVVIGVAIFGYTQYASAAHVSVNVVQNELLGTNDTGSDYYIELELANPSILVLVAGETEFAIETDGEMIGKGVLEPFTLAPLDETTVTGTYHTDGTGGKFEASSAVKISGETRYDMLFASIGVPFEYYPTDKQARDFIHQG